MKGLWGSWEGLGVSYEGLGGFQRKLEEHKSLEKGVSVRAGMRLEGG